MTTDPHPISADTAYLGVDGLARRFADGSLTSADLVDTLLARIADRRAAGRIVDLFLTGAGAKKQRKGKL